MAAVATRRNRPDYSPEYLLGLALSAPLLWPGRTIRLQRDSLLDYHGRVASVQVSVAELYHENSKLSPQHRGELVTTAVDVARFRREFLRRKAAVAAAAGTDQFEQAGFWQRLLGAAFADNPELSYALDVRVVEAHSMYVYEPAAGTLRLSKRMTAEEMRRLAAAVSILEPEAAPQPGASFVLLLGCFPRNEVLFGGRGYRRTLIEAGRATQEIVRQSAVCGRHAVIRCEFCDREVDLLMEADGVEQSVVVVVEFA